MLCGIVGGSVDLIIVVVETCGMAPSEPHNLSSRASNTTSNIQNSVSILDAHLCGKVVFVAGNGSMEAFTISETAEMEGLSPTILVDVCRKIIIGTSQRGVFVLSSL